MFSAMMDVVVVVSKLVALSLAIKFVFHANNFGP